MSRLVALFLAVSVALTSQAVALARGQSAAVGTVVICAGGGFVTLAVDGAGNPTGPAHFCPDAIAALAACGADVPLPVRLDVPVPLTALPPVLLARLRTLPRHARARAPPVPV